MFSKVKTLNKKTKDKQLGVSICNLFNKSLIYRICKKMNFYRSN